MILLAFSCNNQHYNISNIRHKSSKKHPPLCRVFPANKQNPARFCTRVVTINVEFEGKNRLYPLRGPRASQLLFGPQNSSFERNRPECDIKIDAAISKKISSVELISVKGKLTQILLFTLEFSCRKVVPKSTDLTSHDQSYLFIGIQNSNAINSQCNYAFRF